MSRIGYLQVQLVAEQPFTISDPQPASIVDKAVTVDGRGSVIAAATGLIGSLRSHMATEPDVDTVLGPAFGATDGEAPSPSALRALGSRVTGPDGLPLTRTDLRRRATTAVDAHRGAAKARTLRTTEEAPAGAKVTLWCEYDGDIPVTFIERVRDWRPELGGSIGTGHGSARVNSIGVGVLDLTNAADLALYLDGVTPDTFNRVIHDATEVTRTEADYLVDLRCQIVDPLFTAGGTETILSADEEGEQRPSNIALPLTNGADFVLEGSSLRGVLRARVAYIAASVYNADGADALEAVDRGAHVAATIFGSPSQRGMVSIDTAAIADTELSEARMHVAIDRFTGGALPGLLFGERVLARGEFRLKVRSLSINAEDHAWVTALLLAACADINDGLVGLGAMTSRGYGTVKFVDDNQGAPAEVAAALPLGNGVVEKLRTFPTEPLPEPQPAQQPATSPLAEPAPKVTVDANPGLPQAVPAVHHQGRLSLIGKVDWDTCRRFVQDHGLTAMWSGLDGIEAAQALPPSAGTGSHVWGWSNGLWLRARVDGDDCYVAILQPESVPPLPAAESIIERVTVSGAVPWTKTENRLSVNGKATMTKLDLADQWTFTVGTWSPVTFVHVGENPWR